MRTRAVIFPFDLFGGGGCAAGATLLGDALREMIDDTAEEPRPVRQKAFVDSLVVNEYEFDTIEELAKWRDLGNKAFEEAGGDFLLWLSGNHLGVRPVYDALSADDLVIQFDAHLDCYDLHDTQLSLSHGNFLRFLEPPKPKVVNLGHRDLFLPPAAIREHFAAAWSAEDLALDEPRLLAELRKVIAEVKSVWIDLDVDVFDPSICPAVPCPSPCGLTGLQVVKLIRSIGFAKLRGVSLSEFDPGRDRNDASLNLLGWLLEWLLLAKAEEKM